MAVFTPIRRPCEPHTMQIYSILHTVLYSMKGGPHARARGREDGRVHPNLAPLQPHAIQAPAPAAPAPPARTQPAGAPAQPGGTPAALVASATRAGGLRRKRAGREEARSRATGKSTKIKGHRRYLGVQQWSPGVPRVDGGVRLHHPPDHAPPTNRMSRPTPEMMPAVSVRSSPKGLPMASTCWPTCRPWHTQHAPNSTSHIQYSTTVLHTVYCKVFCILYVVLHIVQ